MKADKILQIGVIHSAQIQPLSFEGVSVGKKGCYGNPRSLTIG